MLIHTVLTLLAISSLSLALTITVSPNPIIAGSNGVVTWNIAEGDPLTFDLLSVPQNAGMSTTVIGHVIRANRSSGTVTSGFGWPANHVVQAIQPNNPSLIYASSDTFAVILEGMATTSGKTPTAAVPTRTSSSSSQNRPPLATGSGSTSDGTTEKVANDGGQDSVVGDGKDATVGTSASSPKSMPTSAINSLYVTSVITTNINGQTTTLVVATAPNQAPSSTPDAHEAVSNRKSEIPVILGGILGGVLLIMATWFLCWVRRQKAKRRQWKMTMATTSPFSLHSRNSSEARLYGAELQHQPQSTSSPNLSTTSSSRRPVLPISSLFRSTLQSPREIIVPFDLKEAWPSEVQASPISPQSTRDAKSSLSSLNTSIDRPTSHIPIQVETPSDPHNQPNAIPPAVLIPGPSPTDSDSAASPNTTLASPERQHPLPQDEYQALLHRMGQMERNNNAAVMSVQQIRDQILWLSATAVGQLTVETGMDPPPLYDTERQDFSPSGMQGEGVV